MYRILSRYAGLTALVVLLGSLFLLLPSLGADVFLSPDETANAVAARAFVENYSFRLADEALRVFPWAHPRSFVTTAEYMLVPVGFLGTPLLAAVFLRFFGDAALILLTPLLALTVLIPLWSFTKAWGRWAQIAALVVWMTFPPVLLYVNRGLFPNLPVVCLAVWAAWLIFRKTSLWMLSLAGVLVGVGFMIRPMEAIWIFPWLILAYCTSHSDQSSPRTRKDHFSAALFFFIPFILITMLHGFFLWKTYGSPFLSGYQLRDPADPSFAVVETPSGNAPQTKSWSTLWPFGFHPRNVWFNVRSYLIVFLWPWFIAVCAALVLSWRSKRERWFCAIAVWTLCVLSMMYGQGLYQDHVRANHVSLANSFLRYLLPLAPLVALAVGRCVTAFQQKAPRLIGGLIAVVLIAGLAFFGIWTALWRDDEGLIKSYAELIRYRVIRTHALQIMPPGSFVLSERSDKIFFPWYRAISPLPSRERIVELLQNGDREVALFIRTLTPEQEEEWHVDGIEPVSLMGAGNETLYQLLPNL